MEKAKMPKEKEYNAKKEKMRETKESMIRVVVG